MAVAVEIDETQIRRVPRHVRQLVKGAERVPCAIVRSLVETWRRSAERHEIQTAIAGEIEQLLPPGSSAGGRRHPRQELRGREVTTAAIGLVVPRPVLLGKN